LKGEDFFFGLVDGVSHSDVPFVRQRRRQQS
jgi:hypothetical protein